MSTRIRFPRAVSYAAIALVLALATTGMLVFVQADTAGTRFGIEKGSAEVFVTGGEPVFGGRGDP